MTPAFALAFALLAADPGASDDARGGDANDGDGVHRGSRTMRDGRPVGVLEAEVGYAMSRTYEQWEGEPFFHSVSFGASAHAGWSHRHLHSSIGLGVTLLHGRGESGVGWPSREEPITNFHIPIEWRFGFLFWRVFSYMSMGGAVGWSIKSRYEDFERHPSFHPRPVLVGVGGIGQVRRSRILLGLRAQTELYDLIDAHLGSMVLNVQAIVGVLFFARDRPARRAGPRPAGP